MTLQNILKTIEEMLNNSNSSSNKAKNKKPNSKIIFTIFIVVLIAITGFTSYFMVDETEKAVVLQFGKFDRTVGAGLHFKLPFGIEKNYNVPTQIIQNQTFGFRTAKADVVSLRSSGDYSNESTMLTGDLNIINVEWIIQYRISNPENWLFNVNNKEKTLRDISISIVNQLVGDYYITDVLGDARTEIEESALVLMNKYFNNYELGINVTAVRLQNIVPPVGSVQDAFEDVNKAVQDMNRLINEGREAYNKEIPKSRGLAEQLLQQAQGYATERTNQALGDVARFKSVLTEYNRNPQITRDRLYYETIESILHKQSTGQTQFIDGKFDNLIPFLPLANQTNPVYSPAQ